MRSKQEIKSLYLIFAISFGIFTHILQAQPSCVTDDCCCGVVTQLPLPGGDFEGAPFAPPTTFMPFYAGETFHNWTVLSGSVDLLGPNTPLFAFGNPNGPSQHVDMNGYTNGSMSTMLTGMVAGTTYTIVLWYAKNSAAPVANCNIRVAGGAWLNETWSATNNGGDIWLQRCFTFSAQADMAELRFSGTSNVANAGVLLDDITIWGCPQDKEAPVFQMPPADVTVNCDDNVLLNYNNWVSDFGGAVVTDNCNQPLEWDVEELSPVSGACSSRSVRFTVRDNCDNSTQHTARFWVAEIEKTKEWFIPNVFSPNSDGLNDVWQIFAGDGNVFLKEVAIYDRWGSLIYYWEGYIEPDAWPGWDGDTADGRLASTGVYVYLIRLGWMDGAEEVLSGDLSLFR
jgi:gliding motility-associated-like protein